MPELPEVETVVKTLRPLLIGKKITDVTIFLEKAIKSPSLASFKEIIIGQTINEIQRKAKLIIFVLDEYVLLSHLRMEGKYYFQTKETPIPDKHIQLIINLDDNYNLCYHDTRKFGTFHLQLKQEYENEKPFINIGPEAFTENIKIDYLRDKWKKRTTKVKTALLDQQVMSGLGNIYADEVLFAAKINPEIAVKDLTDEQLSAIIKNATIILNLAVQLGGTTIATYTSSLGVSGKFQNELQVHMRKDKPCYRCQTKITKIKINQRGTYFCTNCQPKK